MKAIGRRKFLMAAAAVLMSMLLVAGQAAAGDSGGGGEIVQLQIITVNDFHGALMENGKNPGAAKLAEYIKERRAHNPAGTLLLGAGDMFTGTPDSNLLYGKPVVDIMNYARFDAMTLGNHEFDWGIDRLKERIAQSDFPYVCANLLDKSTGRPADFVKPYVIVKRLGVNIAIIGIATPETAYKTNPKLIAGYTFEDPAVVVNGLVPELKRKGADIVVVLSHLASWMDGDGNISGDAATLAGQARDIDAIVSAHSHQTVYGKVNGVPVIQASYNGRAAGEIAMTFNKSSRRVENSAVSVTSLSYPGLMADLNVRQILNRAEKELAPVKNTVLGQAARPLEHDRRQPAPTLLGQWVTDTMRQAAGADIAFQNAGGLRTGIAAGAITMGGLYEVIPFDNTLVTVEMTGQQVMKVLEYGIRNGTIGMVQYSGIKVSYSSAGSQQGRMIAVSMPGGTPLDPEKNYKVVTNDFMAAGGDGFTFFKEGRNFYDTGISLRDIIADAIRSQKVIDFSGDDRWHEIMASGDRQRAAA